MKGASLVYVGVYQFIIVATILAASITGHGRDSAAQLILGGQQPSKLASVRSARHLPRDSKETSHEHPLNDR